VPDAVDLSRLIIEGGEAGQARSLLAAQGTELGHADDEGKCGALADALDAGEEFQPEGEILVLAQALEEASDLGIAACGQALDLGFELGLESADGEAVETGLEANDVLLDLLDEGQMLGQGGKSVIAVADGAIVGGRRQGDDAGVDRIGLGSLTPILGIGPDLDRLEDDDLEA